MDGDKSGVYVRARGREGKGRGLAYSVKFIKEKVLVRGSRNAMFA